MTARPRQPAPLTAPKPNLHAVESNAGPVAPTRHDDVRNSGQAHELQQPDAGGRGSAGELAPERLKELLGRLAGGFYDRPEVRDEVIRRLSDDL